MAINKPINQEYQINAYRVLLTRARQGDVVYEDQTPQIIAMDMGGNTLIKKWSQQNRHLGNMKKKQE